MDFTEDNRYLVCAYSSSKKIGIFRLSPEGGTLYKEFPIGMYSCLQLHTLSSNKVICSKLCLERNHYITHLFVSETAERMCILFTCSDHDTMIRVYDGSGNLRARIDNSQLENYGGAFNYHREFFATGSFASDTKIYAIQRVTSSREYKKFGKVMTVTGPTSSAYDVAFDQHDRAAVVSKDGYFYLWTVDVRYQLNEDPRLLNRVALEREMKHVALHPTENVGILEEPGRNYR